ncbi:MAG: DUF4340 domain-containing protein [Congregibacter sp.]
MITRVLASLLILQLALVAFVYWPRESGPASGQALITDLQLTEVIGIEVTDTSLGRAVDSAMESTTADKAESNASGNTSNAASRVQLSRDGDLWRLSSGLPADPTKVDVLLNALLERDAGYAIATSDSAAQRFRVAGEAYERRLVLRTATAEHTAYLGSSPAFRKVHARRDGDNAIFVLELNSYDAPVAEDSWLDRSLLAQSNPSTISLYGTEFLLERGAWRREDGKALDAQAMESLVQALSAVQVTGSVAASDADVAAADEALRITVGNGDAKTRFTVLNNSKSERYYLRRNDFTQTFATSSYDAERLIEATTFLMADDGETDAPET